MSSTFRRIGWGGLAFFFVVALFNRPLPADVVDNWDWHLVNGKKKRHLHWCLATELRKGIPPDSFPKDKADQ